MTLLRILGCLFATTLSLAAGGVTLFNLNVTPTNPTSPPTANRRWVFTVMAEPQVAGLAVFFETQLDGEAAWSVLPGQVTPQGGGQFALITTGVNEGVRRFRARATVPGEADSTSAASPLFNVVAGTGPADLDLLAIRPPQKAGKPTTFIAQFPFTPGVTLSVESSADGAAFAPIASQQVKSDGERHTITGFPPDGAVFFRVLASTGEESPHRSFAVDAEIGARKPPQGMKAFRGAGAFDFGKSQRLTAAMARGDLRFFTVRRAGNPVAGDTPKFKGPAAAAGFVIRYFSEAGADVTADVIAGDYAESILNVAVYKPAALADDDAATFGVNLTSTLDPLARDTVVIDLVAGQPRRTFFVTNTTDALTGGSLRSAITQAQAGKKGRVAFEIPASDPGSEGDRFVIELIESLPTLAPKGGLEIDALTQQVFHGAPAQVTSTDGAAIAFLLTGKSVHLRGLELRGLGIALALQGVGCKGNRVEACRFIGNRNAVLLGGASLNTIGAVGLFGGNTFQGIANGPANRGQFGVGITGTGAKKNRVAGNRFGYDFDGTETRGVKFPVFVSAAAKTRIEANVIAGTLIDDSGPSLDPPAAISVIEGAADTLIAGNTLGLAPDGAAYAGPTSGDGVVIEASSSTRVIENFFGALPGRPILHVSGDGTEIASNIFGEAPSAAARPNALASIRLEGGAGLAITSNRVVNDPGGIVTSLNPAISATLRGNDLRPASGLGIDLRDDGVSANDPGDADIGPNGMQNFPVLTTAESSGTSVRITGTLSSEPGQDYLVDFYADGRWLASTRVRTDASGSAAFDDTFTPLADPAGASLRATATRGTRQKPGTTSELSAAITVTD